MSISLAADSVTGRGYHNETFAAINPLNTAEMVVSYQVPATVAHSTDGGATWRGAPLPGTDAFELAGDPSVTYDGDGHAYALYIAFDRPDDYDTLGRAAHRNGIYINRSDDGGRTWRGVAAPVIERAELPGIPFEDKPMMIIDRSQDAARRGRIYVAWTEFRRHETAILFSRSTDGARTFSTPVEISDRAGSPKDSVGAAEGTALALAPDGTVYVVWSDSTGILLDVSHDGGRTFGRDRLIARTSDIVFGISGIARANGYPSIACDPHDGRLYVLWVDARLGATMPFLITSGDGGTTWSEPRAVAPRDSANRFFAWMALDPSTGLLAVSYYRETTPGTFAYDLAWSTDRGASFTYRQWSAGTFAPRGEFLGDYTGIDAQGGVVAAAWTEARGDSARPAGEEHRPIAHHAQVVAGRAVVRVGEERH
ncbi:MAG TPA: sialidase family protein [Gemmatimonadaceae bacterium]|nr:sialidase family protein [Gemmatimonadaceae bacterium]